MLQFQREPYWLIRLCHRLLNDKTTNYAPSTSYNFFLECLDIIYSRSNPITTM